MGTVPFGDIGLQNREAGYFVHIVHRMGTNYGTCQVVLLPLLWHSKERIVDLHKHYNSSGIVPSKFKIKQWNEIGIIPFVRYEYTLYTNRGIHRIMGISSVPESWPKRFLKGKKQIKEREQNISLRFLFDLSCLPISRIRISVLTRRLMVICALISRWANQASCSSKPSWTWKFMLKKLYYFVD